jgi:hypothetical protein
VLLGLLLGWLLRHHHLGHHGYHGLHLLKHGHLLGLIMLRIWVSHHISHHLLHLYQLLLLCGLQVWIFSRHWRCLIGVSHLGWHLETTRLRNIKLRYRNLRWEICSNHLLLLLMTPLLLLLFKYQIRKGILF